jgi:peptidoglycan hydrolase-like protein with peptidoglycan-binding domain
MRGGVWRAGAAAMAILLCGLPTGAGARERLAQSVPATAPDQPPPANMPAAAPANTLDQIRKAQIELRRLECLKGRADGKLGEQTRQAVRKYWASAKEPAAEVVITDELIAELAGRGDLYCRPPRKFFGFGGRPGGLPFVVPGAPPSPVRVPAPTPTAPPAAAQ